jgi:hypothetical protein
MRPLTALVAALVLALSPGCSTTPTTPTPGVPRSPRSGTWIGTVTDSSNGSGALRVQLDELVIGNAHSLLNGTWTTTFSDATKNGSGDLSGSVSGTAVQVSFRRAVPLSCANPGPVPAVYGSYFSLNLAIAGSTISGPYNFQTCTTAVSGALTLTMQ